MAVTSPTVPIRLEAPCALDELSLRLAIDGRDVSAAQLRPWSPCEAGRRTSGAVELALPVLHGAITAAPPELSP